MSKLTEIANYQYASEAYLFKGKLESEGVEVFLQNEHTINTDPVLSNAVGGVKLFVKTDYVIKAKQILSTISSYSLDDNGLLLSCPKCGEQKIEFLSTIKNIASFFGFIFGMFLAILPFYTKYKYRCESCNFEF